MSQVLPPLLAILWLEIPQCWTAVCGECKRKRHTAILYNYMLLIIWCMVRQNVIAVQEKAVTVMTNYFTKLLKNVPLWKLNQARLWMAKFIVAFHCIAWCLGKMRLYLIFYKMSEWLVTIPHSHWCLAYITLLYSIHSPEHICNAAENLEDSVLKLLPTCCFHYTLFSCVHLCLFIFCIFREGEPENLKV